MTGGDAELAGAIARGDRRALARAITLVESTRPDHRARAEALLQPLLPATGKSVRIGISGAPGVGKSSFIEAFGLMLLAGGHRLAVLAIDPSSKRGGGSILGDKTRMEKLARAEAAFIRPSPAGLTLGGVARRTREAMLLCEAAGFDVILIETVGVGQSETAVADLADIFLLLLAPGGGDELQGLKKGIVELADLLIVTKADGDLIPAATRAVADYRHALGLLASTSMGWTPEIHAVSAFEGHGMVEVWQAIERHRRLAAETGEGVRHRRVQVQAALWSEIGEALIDRIKHDPTIARLVTELEPKVAASTLTPSAA